MTRLAVFMLMAGSLCAADFQSGQAARAVLGQSSFSAQDAGISATSLAISNGHLYAADTANRLLTFDLANIPGATEDLANRQGSACVLCGFSPVNIANQPVLQGLAAVSVFGTTVVFADTSNRRVLIWRDVSVPSTSQAPDIVLGGDSLIAPVSVAFDGKHLFVGDAALHRVLIWNSIPSTPRQSPDAVLGSVSDTPGADTISRPAALASDGVNLFVGDDLDRRILVFTPGDIPLPKNAVLNSASRAAGPLAPGTLVTISGAGLSDTSDSAPDDAVEPLPKKLAGVEVFFDGVMLPLLSASPTEIRAQLPYDTGNASAGSLYVRTEHAAGVVTTTNAFALQLTPANPGLFAFGGTEPRGGIVLHGNPDSPDEPATPVTPENPAQAGEILTLWAAGLGSVEDTDVTTGPVAGFPYDAPDAPVSIPISAFVNGRSAQVISANLPHGAIGVYEIRIALPPDLAPDPKAQLIVMQDGFVSNTVTLSIRGPIQ